MEASGINNLVPGTRTLLRRETVALATQLATLDMAGAGACGSDGSGGAGAERTAVGQGSLPTTG